MVKIRVRFPNTVFTKIKKGENIMEKEKLYEILETMTEQLGADVLLENMAMAMSYDELKENLEFIDRMHNLENF